MESEEPEDVEVELDGSYRDKPVKITIDTGSRRNYINADLVPKSKQSRIANPLTVTTGNGAREEISKYSLIEISFKQIPNTSFKVKCLLMPNLPCDINLGREFIGSEKVIID